MELPKILKRCRNSKDFTQAQVVKILHVSRKAISNWESGRSDPDLKMLTKISDLYQVSTDILLQNRDIKNNRIFTISYILNIFLLFLTYLDLFNFFEPESKIFPLLLSCRLVILGA